MIESGLKDAAIAENLKQFLLVLSVSLSVATLPQVFSWFRRIPYTLLLVIVGLGLALVDVRLINLSPQLILGNFGSLIGMNPRTRIIVSEFWEFLAFFVNSIVFLLTGDQIRFAILGENIGAIAVTIAAVIGTRAIAIYSLSGLSNRFAKSEIPKWKLGELISL